MSQTFTTIIDTDILAQHIDAPAWRIMDCRFDLMDKEAGLRSYREAHIPNALYAHLEHDLSGPHAAITGRHPLPEAAQLAQRFCEWGIGAETQLVVYDGQNGALASRLWWLSRWLGHDRVAVLNGGLTAWCESNWPTSQSIPAITPTEFIPGVNDDLWVTTAVLQQLLANKEILLIDARDEARFRGEVEPLDKVAGHIPGAMNWPFETNLDTSGKFLTPEKLQANLPQKVTNSVINKFVHSCGSGVTACHNILAMEIMGLSGSRLYPGSWSEWITDPRRPIRTVKDA